MSQLTWEEAEKYVFALPLHTKKNPFAVTKAFYQWLGEPGSGVPIVHVAGTNGKGSVCAYLNSIFSTAGYRVGVFTSPHLVDIRERFVLENSRIAPDVFAGLLNTLLERLTDYEDGAYHPTFFETLFFLFMLWMEEEEPDCVILETGMGGRLDVTNVISHPAVTVITRIGLDHCEYLGDTAEKIAQEKVCIFKEKIPAVCQETEEKVTRVFVEKAQKLSVPLVMVSKNEVSFSKLKKNSIDFFLKSAYDRDIETHLETIAVYQAENAALAVRAAEQLHAVLPVTAKQTEDGLARMRWEARMEEVLPDVYLDGAHNPDGIRAFLQSVKKDGFLGERWLLFGACADKSVEEMVRMLRKSGLFAQIFGTCTDSMRSLTRQELAGILQAGQPEDIYEDAACAFTDMIRRKREGVRIYIAGSLYLAGEVKRCLGEQRRTGRLLPEGFSAEVCYD